MDNNGVTKQLFNLQVSRQNVNFILSLHRMMCVQRCLKAGQYLMVKLQDMLNCLVLNVSVGTFEQPFSAAC